MMAAAKRTRKRAAKKTTRKRAAKKTVKRRKVARKSTRRKGTPVPRGKSRTAKRKRAKAMAAMSREGKLWKHSKGKKKLVYKGRKLTKKRVGQKRLKRLGPSLSNC